ncbi:nicotinate-nucleotide--dimethylbenzimidazole phosphoribosyltransferase [Streptomyces sp. NBC_00989]|uniref:nicotinate-nucleotide--dimethylbenzimidazole phosphoribosyltransferase n=1 Tax=Streptomyces sp. NBC_00989 TaxID=2903705 RepID=UPI003870534F|nr:nicotinate-nucleotide--dimethylbenzimidazole phosphoribosyltransferase [Streptomyces sp. NBC_00989]
MTDTGQIPAEGLPENAGMVEQPGVPAHGAYTYLSETTAEDEDLLLLPGAQGAWGNEVPPPAPEPVVETVQEPAPQEAAPLEAGVHEPGAQEAAAHEAAVHEAGPYEAAAHEPGPHETAGRDSGSVDLGGVRLPAPPPPAPVPPRRPLHLGPPLPDTSASPVRSLADRGPAGAPVRQQGPPTTGPEYFDAPQLRALPPQGATPWGAQAPVSAGVPAAETVVPVGEPAGQSLGGGIAMALDTGVVAPEPEPGPVMTAGASTGKDADLAQAPDAGGAWQGHGQMFAGEPAAAFAHVSTESSGNAGVGVAEVGQLPESAEELAAEPAQAQAQAHDQVHDQAQAPVQAQVDVPGSEAGFAPVGGGLGGDALGGDAGYVPEGAGAFEAVPVAGDAFVVDAVQEPEQVAAPVAVPGADVAPEPEAVQVSEEAFASEGEAEVDALPETVGVAEAGQGFDAGFAAANEQGAEAEVVYGAEQVAPQPVVAQGPEEVLAQAVAPEPVLAHDTAQAPEAVAAPEPIQAEDVAYALAPTTASAPDQNLEAPHAHEITPVDETAAIQEAEQTPPVFPGVETPLAPEAAPLAEGIPAPVQLAEPEVETEAEAEVEAEAEAQATPAPEPVVAEVHATETAEPLLPVGPQTHPVAPEAIHLAQQAEDGSLSTGVAMESEPEVQPRPHPDDSLGRFVPVEGSVPTTPHLAPTPPHPLILPAEEAFAAVSAPREADPADPDLEPELVQHADDLDTRAADQEEESTAVVEAEDVRESTGPAAPAYDDAEREAVLKVMRERRDIRNGFRSDPIPHDVLLRVLEAAHTAPSVGHSQPWDFVVIRSADTRRNMHELAQSQREAYAKSLPKGRAKQFKELKIEAILDTPVNIVVTADPTRGGRHTLGRHTQPQMAPYSAALAVENLWLAARAEGLGVGWVSFFDEREMVRALGLPEHLEVIAYLCVGYVDEFPDEPELMQAGWSKRRPLSWVVHEETYGRRALPGEDPHDLLAETVAGIRPLDAKALGEAWERQKRMTKPPGSLGMLEIISAQLAGLSRQCPPPIPEPAAVAIFAGDHGVHAQGVTPWPQEVTAQMVANFLGGGAVCNAFASQVGAEVCVVDVGVASELPATPGLLPRKIRAGTSDMTTGPAMSREEAKQAIEVGIETARDLVAAGNKALLTGEMGIANTTASAALISVFTDTDPAEVTGRGTGINDETLARKTEVVRRAIELHQPDPADPIGVLAAVGGFEHAAMVGLLLGGASLRTPVILDGVSAGAAALVARAIAPEVLAACIAGHRSAEPGHVAALNKLGLRPLVDLDLRLGEGTGALLALPLVQSTARAMHEVATFDSAGVTEK